MHRETKATGIPIEVKKAVFKRDGEKCVWCGSPLGVPTAHIVRRSHGGRGIEQNIVTLCPECHREMDEGKNGARIMEYVRWLMTIYYPGWKPEDVIYHKYKEENDAQQD